MTKILFAAATALCLALPAMAADFISLDRAGARALVDPSAHGRPTAIALWSSDCVHCKKNLRLLGSLARNNKQLQVMTVATEPESPELATFLDGTGVKGTRYAYGSDAPEALAYALDPAWRGELPRTLLLDGKGGRVAISGILDEAALRQSLGLARSGR
ncbi:MAG: TlpA family protein disulfide reductase [Actinomycetota bacterium]